MTHHQVESGLLLPPDDLAATVPQTQLFIGWDALLQADHGVRSQAGVAYTFYTPSLDHWAAIDSVTKGWWGESKPTSTFLVTERRPDGRSWADAKVAMEVVAVTGPVAVSNLYLDENQFKSQGTYCHAKVVETAECREVFFSGMCGMAGNNQEGYRIIGENLQQQAHFALMYCKQLCEKANITVEDVDRVDVFYLPPYLPKYVVAEILHGTVDEMTNGFFPKATISLIPVTGLFMPGLLVEIRPHAVIWKE